MKHEAMLYQKTAHNNVQCLLCAHRCSLKPAQFGVCGVRQNIDGKLYSDVYGEIIAAHIDPIEKKPLYHFLPGSASYSIATRGCNFQCGFCQNWQISQARHEHSGLRHSTRTTPEVIVAEAVRNKCASIAYTYTEPTVYFEFAYDTARLAREAGLANVFVTNGFMSAETLETIAPFLDAANVDLKSFNKDFYLKICKGELQPVLDTIRAMNAANVWVEVTTLIVPGQNDSPEELSEIAGFIAATDRDIPWHVNRFHPDYQFTDSDMTPIATLYQARTIAEKAGLRYVYLGNTGERADTRCSFCGTTVVNRSYSGTELKLTPSSECPSCGAAIAGIWK